MRTELSFRDAGTVGSLGVGLAASLGTFIPFDAYAQNPGSAPVDSGVIPLEEITVAGYDGRLPNTLNADLGLSRFPGRVQDTPQAVTVVPGEVIRQQQATTLEQALRNVPALHSAPARATVASTATSSASAAFRPRTTSTSTACATSASTPATASTSVTSSSSRDRHPRPSASAPRAGRSTSSRSAPC
jgi:hypothetical protein